MTPAPVSLLSATLAEHSVESLYAMHGRQRPWIYWLSLLAIGAALVALPLFKVEITVRAAGMVRPAVERTDLKAAVSACIVRVLARDNERVTAGQPLLELNSRDPEERLARNRALQRDKSSSMADLAALTIWLAPPARANGLGSLPDEAVVNVRTPMWARAYEQFLVQRDTAELALTQARSVRKRTDSLAAKGIVTARETDDARYTEAHALVEVRMLVRQTSATWQAQLREEQTALEQFASEEKRLQEELALYTVRSPADGTVQGLVGLSPGGYVSAGQSLGAVSPDERLLVETFVSSRDIGLIRPGQRVRLQVDAFPYTQWGLLDGTVQHLAADATVNGAQTAFRVVVLPAALTLQLRNGSAGQLCKGMTVTTRFVVGRRNLLQVLYEDAAGWLNPQAGPRPS